MCDDQEKMMTKFFLNSKKENMLLHEQLRRLEVRRQSLQNCLSSQLNYSHYLHIDRLTLNDLVSQYQLSLSELQQPVYTLKTTPPAIAHPRPAPIKLSSMNLNQLLESVRQNIAEIALIKTTTTRRISTPQESISLSLLKERHQRAIQRVTQESRNAQDILAKVDRIARGSTDAAMHEMAGLRAAVAYLQRVVGCLSLQREKSNRSGQRHARKHARKVNNDLDLTERLIQCKQQAVSTFATQKIATTTMIPYLHENLPRILGERQDECENAVLSAQEEWMNNINISLGSHGLTPKTRSYEGLHKDAQVILNQLSNANVLSGVASALYDSALKEGGSTRSRAIQNVVQQIEKKRTILLESLERSNDKADQAEQYILRFGAAVGSEKLSVSFHA